MERRDRHLRINKLKFSILFVLISLSLVYAEDSNLNIQWKGQASVIHASSLSGPFDESPTTIRYIPQLRLDYQSSASTRLGFDAAVDVYNYSLGDSLVKMDGELYRFTFRYDTPRTQVRVGLQKINFGPARMLRVLQWFDQLDPRDPLALSRGVWAAMGRYYFESGANVRLWTMADAPDPGRDTYTPNNDMPIDIGGRLEYPIPAGTLGITLHSMGVAGSDVIQEERAAFDLRVDAIVGLWTEVMYSHSDNLILQDMVSSMIGIDYTFALGNGLYTALESNTNHFGNIGEDMPWIGGSTALMGTYTLGLSDGLTAYIYAINLPGVKTQYMPMVGWQHTSGNWLCYLALYDMPKLAAGGSITRPAGTGLQLNIAFNH